MDFINGVKSFHNSLMINQLSTGQIALYYALFNINNACNWIEWFSVPSSVLQLYTGLSRKAMQNARNVLMQKGYIQYKTSSTKAPRYKVACAECLYQNYPSYYPSYYPSTTQDTTQVTTQDTTQETTTLNRLNKTRLNKNNIEGEKAKRFVPPTPEEVNSYCLERKNGIDAQRFVDFYESKGWFVGKNKMKDWKAAVRNWEQRQKETPQVAPATPKGRIYTKDHFSGIAVDVEELAGMYEG